MSSPVIQLAGLQTEGRNTRTTNIDRVSTVELCRTINREDHGVPLAVEQCIPVIARVIDVISERMRNGGRVFYIGAGTSGRLGVLDASEISPTYSAPPHQFLALIAGGDNALRRAEEGAEDDRNGAKIDLQSFCLDPKVDSLIGIASSGRTPYVLGGLSYVKSLGATTVALVCVSPSEAGIEGNADYLISAVTGPEVVTGSTRMKAGTATKLILNLISTGIMVKLGKTYGNLMVDVKATNTKLRQRARNILQEIGGALRTHSDTELDHILRLCDGSVKLAAVTVVLKVPVAEARDRLQRNNGVLAAVFNEAQKNVIRREISGDDLVLCVDAGGTSCKAVIMSRMGDTGLGTAGPCNVTAASIENAVATIQSAIQGAVDNLKSTAGCQIPALKVSAAWVAMAGYGRPSLRQKINNALSELLNPSVGKNLRITNDIDLLLAPISCRNNLESIIVVVAGTGSIAMSYARVDGQFRQTHRIGGWGHLLGDEGSAYSMGREALRSALYSSDLYSIQAGGNPAAPDRKIPSLTRAVSEHFKALYPEYKSDDLLGMILAPDQTLHGVEENTHTTTKRIAGVAKLVLSMIKSDNEARRIVNTCISRLVELVALLVHSGGINPATSGLVLAGGMMQDHMYRATVLTALEAKCGKFKQTKNIAQPAFIGAQYMLNQVE